MFRWQLWNLGLANSPLNLQECNNVREYLNQQYTEKLEGITNQMSVGKTSLHTLVEQMRANKEYFGPDAIGKATFSFQTGSGTAEALSNAGSVSNTNIQFMWAYF